MGNVTASLRGASLRVGRAAKHFDELEEEFQTFRRANLNKISIKQDEISSDKLFISFDDSLIVPGEMSLPLGDCIYNMRAALDYLVYELALLDSGKRQDGTQFPIEDDRDKFNKHRRNTYLLGLSDDHIRAIEALQPYAGVEWTRTLRELSNPDKHRRLIPVKAKLAGSFFAYPYEGRDGAEISAEGGKMYVDKEQTLEIGFLNSPNPVIETINLLLVKVSETIEAFKPEFE